MKQKVLWFILEIYLFLKFYKECWNWVEETSVVSGNKGLDLWDENSSFSEEDPFLIFTTDDLSMSSW